MMPRALVVGAGPAGLGAAVQLASWCSSVTVAEARPRARQRHIGEHLPPAGLAALAALGFGALLEDKRHSSSYGVSSVWGDEKPAERDYFFTIPGRGLNLRREVFDASLMVHAKRHGADLRYDTRLAGLAKDPGGYVATLRDGQGSRTLEVDIVVDAGGRQARAARQLGAAVHRSDQLVAIVGRISGCAPADDAGRLYIEATEQGWWYGVMFPEGMFLCAFMTDVSAARAHPYGASGLWQEALNQSAVMSVHCRDGHWAGEVEVFDAATQSLSMKDEDTFLAVGDAATAFDPLSSWGIAKGLLDGFAGAEALQMQHRGEVGALAKHRAIQRNNFQRYRTQHRQFYRAETRWPKSEFWRVRQQASRPAMALRGI